MPMTRVLCFVSALLLLLGTSVFLASAKCSSETSCEECLANSPAFSFGFAGDFCKFCPQPALGPKYPVDDETRKLIGDNVGACWDESSGDDRAKDSDGTVGGCTLMPKDSNFAHKGWLMPGANRAEALAMQRTVNRTRIKEICNSVRHLKRQAASAASSALGTASQEQIDNTRQSMQTLATLQRDVMLMLKVRSIDPAWFTETIPDFKELAELAKDASWAVGSQLADALVPSLGYVVTAASFTETVTKSLQKHAERIVSMGGEAPTYAFPEVTYRDLWQAYMKFLTAAKINSTGQFEHPVNILKSMLKLDQATLEGSSSGVSVANEVNNHVATKITKVALYSTLAVLTAGISLAVTIPVELAVTHSLKYASNLNSKEKLGLILTGMFNMEGCENGLFVLKTNETNPLLPEKEFVKGPMFCDITDYDKPNHGCAEGLRCVRGPRAVFPLNPEFYTKRLFSSYGFCSPVPTLQMDIGGPCMLDMDCMSGYCATGVSSIEVVQRRHKVNITLDSRTRMFRGDMPVAKPYAPVPLDNLQRLNLLQGRCTLAGKSRAPLCRKIGPDFKFWECPAAVRMPRGFFGNTTKVPIAPKAITVDDIALFKRRDSRAADKKGLKRSKSMSALDV